MSFICVYPALAHLLTMSDKSVWVAGQPKMPIFGAIGSAMTPLSKPLPESLSTQQPRNSSVPLGLNLDFSFLEFSESTNGCNTCNSSSSIWISGIHHHSLLLFQPIYLIFLLLAQRWKSWEQILRYARHWSLQTVICTFYCSPGDA